MKASVIAVGCALLWLPGCARNPELRSSEAVTVSKNEPLGAPTRDDLATPGLTYIIGPYDELDVVAFNMPDLSRKVRVDADGTASLPLVGPVKASGLTPIEFARGVEAALRQHFVRFPQVSVSVSDVVSQTVTVDGEVKIPGSYPLVGKTSLLRVLAKAQGATQYAKLSHVVLYRQVDGKKYAALYDLRAVRAGYYADPDIYPNDLVVVGTSQARRVFGDIVAATGLITTPIALILR
jgi:polysaccharide export outer membrane protein